VVESLNQHRWLSELGIDMVACLLSLLNQSFEPGVVVPSPLGVVSLHVQKTQRRLLDR
jgi:hypothetical protein